MPVVSPHAYRFAMLLGLLILVIMGGSYIHDYARVLGDPDTFWHVKLGSDIISTGQLPVVDSYSHSYAGQPFVSKEWLSEVFLAGAFKAWGWNGVIALTAVVAVAAVLVLYRELARFLHPTMAGLFAIIVTTMLNPVVLARPHLFTLPIAAYFTARLFRAAEAQEAPKFWLLAFITLWANLHGSFTLGFVIAGFAFLHLLENIRLSNKPLLLKWVIFLALCPLAAMIHPYGYEPIRIGLQMMATNKAMAYIIEWMPLNAQDDFIIEYFVLASLVGLIGARMKLGWAKTLFIVFMLHMMFTHVRFVYVFFLLVPIIIAPHLAERFPEASLEKWLQRPRDVVERFATNAFWPLAGLISIGAVAAGAWFLQARMPAPPEDTAAEKPIAYAMANHLDGPVFNEYRYGGSLIFHGIKTFVDGRAEQLFTGDFFPDYVNSGKHDGAKLFGQLVEKYKLTWSLLPIDDLRNGYLEQMGWKKAYTDEKTAIYVKP
ncbi:MAG: hypothetical protein KGO94_09525 [Alphaproteobacteria bacterium]|nr:hypothetical protein [Alphaproteobacteria bacterium]